MPVDTPPPDQHRDPRDSAAAIPPVTDAMMDHAAHEAAALADGVARHVDHAADGSASGAARTAVEAAGTAVNGAAEDAAQAAEAVAEHAARAAEGAADAARERLSASADALSQYNAKVFEMVRTNLASATALVGALLQAKSVPEAVSINADHLRRQMDTLTSQGRELANLAQTVALDALRPLKGRSER